MTTFTRLTSILASSAVVATGFGTLKPAPSFSAQASDGKTYTLKTLSGGKPLLLMFLSAGCEHNPQGIKDLNRLQAILGGKVRIAAMANLDTHQTTLLAKNNKAHFPILADQMAQTIGAFGGKGGLDNVLVLSSGQIAHVWTGYDRTTLKQVEIVLRKNHGPNLNLDLSAFPKDRQAGCAIGMSM